MQAFQRKFGEDTSGALAGHGIRFAGNIREGLD
jgi:hypothetical protein